MAGGNKGFGALLTEGLDEEQTTDSPTSSESVMASRTHALARIAAGKVVTDRTEFVDPDRCRPWRLHNRDLDHLSEDSCRDLIDAFLSAKKQRIPAIVRRVRGEPGIDYEIIAGVRRWWTVRWLREHHHPEFEYLVTVQQLTDEEAFRVSDIENRSRKDISDWERAREYLGALTEFYDGSQAQMAEHLKISKSWLSRMIDVARLPDEIVGAFADTHHVTVRIARDLKPLTADARTRKLMAAEAAEIVAQREAGDPALTGVETAKRLIRATAAPSPKARKRLSSDVNSAAGKPMLRIVRGERGGGLTFKVLPKSGATKAELLDTIGRALDER